MALSTTHTYMPARTRWNHTSVVMLACLALAVLARCVHARQPIECRPASSNVFLLRNTDDLDALLADCKVLVGNVEILCSSADPTKEIRDLEVFQFVHTITGYLRIQNCPELTTLEGFRSLKKIEGNQLYNAPNGEQGFALYILNNPKLASLNGFQNLTDIQGSGVTGRGRVSISANSNLCYLDRVDWSLLVGEFWDRLVFYVPGSNCNSASTTCDPSCGCGACFAGGATGCQGFCFKDDNTDEIIIGVIIGGCVFLALVVLFMWLYLTRRCGCRLRVGKKSFQIGVVKSYNGIPWSSPTSAALLAHNNNPLINGSKDDVFAGSEFPLADLGPRGPIQRRDSRKISPADV